MCAVKGFLKGGCWVDVHSCSIVNLRIEFRDLYILYFMQIFNWSLLIPDVLASLFLTGGARRDWVVVS